jgi:hypothetical protein
MSMSPITYQGLSFVLPLAAMNAVLNADALNQAFCTQAVAHQSASPTQWSTPTASMWASSLSARNRDVPADQVRAVLAASLVGGGMLAATAAGTADRLYAGQFDRAVDQLAAAIVLAAIAAG